MCELWDKLKNTEKPILLYGMGNGADKIYNELSSLNINISGVFSTAEFVRDKTVYGFKLSSYEEMKQKFKSFIVLVCFGTNRSEVFEEISRIASEQELYFPDVPVYGSDVFNLDFAKAHKKELLYVYNLLSDEKSRKTFENTVLYKLTGKCDYLYDIEEDYNEPFETFFPLSKNESYLDLGAYTGDTVTDFLNRVNSYKEIIAVEPNPRSFKKLCENTKNVENIINVNKYISDNKGEIQISTGHGRGTSSVKKGVSVLCDTADNIAQGKNITFLKADVEGEELKMIKGASNIIKSGNAKLQIACYHKSDDLWTIPKAVLEISDNYNIYMRHFPYLPAWDTNFYFVPKR